LKSKKPIIILFCVALAILIGCTNGYTPKPSGYARIDLPEKKYNSYTGDCPFTFEYPQYAEVNPHQGQGSMPCWLNMDFPGFKGRLHLSYFAVDEQDSSFTSIDKFLEDTRGLAYKHTIKAQAIEETIIRKDTAKVHGIIYEIQGSNTASSLQFFLTDSSNHFMRGALYFNVAPNNDSLFPVINFIKEDVGHFIETFEWKKDPDEKKF